IRDLTSSRGAAGETRHWEYGDATRPHFATMYYRTGDPTAQYLNPTVFGEVGSVWFGQQGEQDPMVWNAQGKLYQFMSSTYSYDWFDQNTLIVTGSPTATSIVRVGDDFEYDIGAGRATKYFSVDGVRIAALATNYTPGAASLPPALRPVVRTLEPIAAPLAAGLLLVGFVSLAAVATRRRPPVWVAAPGVGVLSLVLVGLPLQAVAATLPLGGPGKYG